MEYAVVYASQNDFTMTIQVVLLMRLNNRLLYCTEFALEWLPIFPMWRYDAFFPGILWYDRRMYYPSLIAHLTEQQEILVVEYRPRKKKSDSGQFVGGIHILALASSSNMQILLIAWGWCFSVTLCDDACKHIQLTVSVLYRLYQKIH